MRRTTIAAIEYFLGRRRPYLRVWIEASSYGCMSGRIESSQRFVLWGGSGTQYFVGDFDGTRFTNDNPASSILWIDYGRDNYAGVTWSDHPQNATQRLFLGWMSNWDYAQGVPAYTFRSAMTLPRVLKLQAVDEGLRLVSQPVPELQSLRQSEPVRTVTGPNPRKSRGLCGRPIEG